MAIRLYEGEFLPLIRADLTAKAPDELTGLLRLDEVGERLALRL